MSASQTTEIDVWGFVEALGPQGVCVVLVIALIYVGKSERGRAAIKRAFKRLVRKLHIRMRARLWGVPDHLAKRLMVPEWSKAMSSNGLAGLKRGKIVRTPYGARVYLRYTDGLHHGHVANNLARLETALGLRPDSVRLKPNTNRADRGSVEFLLRDPLAGDLLWAAPVGPVHFKDPVVIARDVYGEPVSIDMRNRIGVFGTSGSGKSCVQRVMGAHVIQCPDADLEVWDLKQGLESQHFAGKASRVTDSQTAVSRVDWLLEEEFPRRAAVMKRKGTSSWKETPEDRALVIMVDEGNVITRDFKDAQLKRFFTAIEQGRALGVYFVWVTQFPKSTNLPTELRSQLNVRVCLRLESSEESRLVFKDEAGDGWEPHKLRDHWLLVKSSKHRAPTESKSVYLDEDVFKTIPLAGSLPETGSAPGVISESPSGPEALGGIPENLLPWVFSEAPEQPLRAPEQPLRKTRDTAKTLSLEVLQSTDVPLGVSQIAAKIGRDKAGVSRALRALADEGVVVCDGDKYRICV